MKELALKIYDLEMERTRILTLPPMEITFETFRKLIAIEKELIRCAMELARLVLNSACPQVINE